MKTSQISLFVCLVLFSISQALDARYVNYLCAQPDQEKACTEHMAAYIDELRSAAAARELDVSEDGRLNLEKRKPSFVRFGKRSEMEKRKPSFVRFGRK